MPMTIVSRVAARAMIPAALAAGSLSLAATAAGACTGPACGGGPPPVAAPLTCTTPDCIRGVPPAAAAMECTDPRCVSSTPPAAAIGGDVRFGGPGGGSRNVVCLPEVTCSVIWALPDTAIKGSNPPGGLGFGPGTAMPLPALADMFRRLSSCLRSNVT
jgi:hypothetical protein